ncbi:MAG: PTS sugar transporter subunit IIA [Mycobacterium leprae]
MDAGVLTKEQVGLDVEAADWRSAVQALGNVMEGAGAVSEAYTKGMIVAIEAKGPYVVVGPGVAMPHASPDHAKRVAIGVVRLKTPVAFGNPEYDPVDLLFSLCSPDFLSHISMLVGLSQLMANQPVLNEIRAAADAAAVVAIMERNM